MTKPSTPGRRLYDVADGVITELLGEPDRASGHYMLDRGNLQHLIHKVLLKFLDNELAIDKAKEFSEAVK